ncbi:oligosaccharide repeat unit polymerase, partial [Klebsiella pneumoniae]|nr:oligosaccharide repeat unit polymerase [Klebsiella pneumoniae]
TTFALFIWSKKFTNTKVSKTFTLLVFIVFIFAIILNTGKQIVFMVIISYAFIVGVNRVKHYVYLITAVGVLFSLYMLF